jgi:deoxyadenosine/deoxycytidine kinase
MKLQKDILTGILLGDASLSWNRDKTKARLHLRQKNKPYFDHLCEIFGDYITAKPHQNKLEFGNVIHDFLENLGSENINFMTTTTKKRFPD